MNIRSVLVNYRSRLYKSLINYDKWGGRKNYLEDEGNRVLGEIIAKGESSSVIRMGFAELMLFYEYEWKQKNPDYSYNNQSAMAGTFANDEEVACYIGKVIHAYQDADCLVNWYSGWKEEKVARKYFRGSYMVSAHAVEPYYFSDPWSKQLEGKKVLVVTPFVDEVWYQYDRRQKVWHNDLLPDFQLKTVQSVWFAGKAGKDGRFTNWFDALEYLEKCIDQVDYEIALLGCGPFGVPLCDHIKQQGKIAIYIGGALQILFGIKGSRWDKHPFISQLYNEYWIRPGETTKPDNPKALDNRCYW